MSDERTYNRHPGSKRYKRKLRSAKHICTCGLCNGAARRQKYRRRRERTYPSAAEWL